MYMVRESDGQVTASSESYSDATAARKGDAIIWDSSRWAIAGEWLPVTREQLSPPTLAMSATVRGGE